jgi:hypothetical protein
MEKQHEPNERVQISQAVFDGLEFIRRSGATNMFDRPMVLHLAREWDFVETAAWIERVDTGTYGRLILQGPEVITDDRTSQASEPELTNEVAEVDDDAIIETDGIDETEVAWDTVRRTMYDLIATLNKQAVLTIADVYDIERTGVLFAPAHRDGISAERAALIRNLGLASSLWQQLETTMTELQRGIASLQYMIDPENN